MKTLEMSGNDRTRFQVVYAVTKVKARVHDVILISMNRSVIPRVKLQKNSHRICMFWTRSQKCCTRLRPKRLLGENRWLFSDRFKTTKLKLELKLDR